MRSHTPISRPRADESPSAMQLRSQNARLQQECEQSINTIRQLELLAREGDHRIKNSLQIVASGLARQARGETNTQTRQALLAAVAKIQAVAQIHDALQLSTRHNHVDLSALLAKMCATLVSLVGDDAPIQISVHAPPVEAPLAIAQPLLLAANELIINALRHAFPNGRTGSITVTLAFVDQHIRLNVTDDGCGLPKSFASSSGYGTRLIHALVAKIEGRIAIEKAVGTSFTIVAALPETAPDSVSSASGAR